MRPKKELPEVMSDTPSYQSPVFFSYGFRPFFFSAAMFAGLAIPIWILILIGADGVDFHFAPRDWHVHEMLFGFLPCVITGFLLTAMPNWTDRPPIKGLPLFALLTLWLAGRLAIAVPWVPSLAATIIDGAFLLTVAGIVWREIVVGKTWDRLPIGMLVSLYAIANLLFHTQFLQRTTTDLAERMALAIIMLLLALIGGRVTPGFTEDFLVQENINSRPAPFSAFDGLAIGLIAIAVIVWIGSPQSLVAGWLFVVGGVINLVRLTRWHGWLTWREPLVMVLHVGYGWLAMSFLFLGGSILEIGLHVEDAVHALTTGAVGVMTLGIMTRASLGHTGRTKQAGALTIMIFFLVNLGALLRVFGSSLYLPENIVLILAGMCWSGAYLAFVAGYGPILFAPSKDEP